MEPVKVVPIPLPLPPGAATDALQAILQKYLTPLLPKLGPALGAAISRGLRVVAVLVLGYLAHKGVSVDAAWLQGLIDIVAISGPAVLFKFLRDATAGSNAWIVRLIRWVPL